MMLRSFGDTSNMQRQVSRPPAPQLSPQEGCVKVRDGDRAVRERFILKSGQTYLVLPRKRCELATIHPVYLGPHFPSHHNFRQTECYQTSLAKPLGLCTPLMLPSRRGGAANACSASSSRCASFSFDCSVRKVSITANILTTAVASTISPPMAVDSDPTNTASDASVLHSTMPMQASVAVPQAREKIPDSPSSTSETRECHSARFLPRP